MWRVPAVWIAGTVTDRHGRGQSQGKQMNWKSNQETKISELYNNFVINYSSKSN